MNIILIASLKEYTTANYFVEALNGLGHNLLVCSDIKNEYVNEVISGGVDVQSLIIKHSFEPDAIFFIEGGTHRVIPLGMSSLNCIKIWYGIDTHMNYKKHLLVSRLFDVTLIAQKQYVKNLLNDGIENVIWLPLGFPNKLLQQSSAVEKNIDISYVGSTEWEVNRERYNLLQIIEENFKNISIGKASNHEMIQIYSKSKIVFNKSVNNDVNMRFFEAMGSGAILVTDRIIDNGVEDLFEEGINYYTYTDAKSLIELINHLLDDDDLIKSSGYKNKKMIESMHTYEHRAKKIIDIILESSKSSSLKLLEDEFSVALSHKMIGQSIMICSKLISKLYTYGKRRVFLKLVGFVLLIIGYLVLLIENLITLFNK